ncbi:unnamed protein product [Somion occarium]
MITDVVAQRDDAEAAAARARTTARRLKEEQIMFRAREEGRRQGYEEGLKQAREEARAAGYRRARSDTRTMGDDVIQEDDDEPDFPVPDNDAEDVQHTDALDGLSMLGLPNMVPQGQGQGAPGSRFREHGISPAPTNSSLYPSNAQHARQAREEQNYISPMPVPVYNAPPSPSHPPTPIPPDGYIPRADEGFIPLPPPHEMGRPPPSPNSPAQPLPIPEPQPRVAAVPNFITQDRNNNYSRGGRTSPRSLAESVPSTTISQFELVNSSPRSSSRNNVGRDRDRDRDIRERKSGLSVIHEGSVEYSSPSPGMDNRRMPDPVTFPTPAGASNSPSDWGVQGEGDVYGRGTPRNRKTSQRLADELRYENADAVEEWRRSAAAEEVRSQSSRPSLRRPHNVTVPSPLAQESIRPSSSVGNRPPSAVGSRPRSPLGARPMSPGNLQGSQRSRPPRTPVSDHHDGSSMGHRTGTSEGEIFIDVIPPSGSGSEFSPTVANHSGLLSPNSAHEPLPRPPTQPIVPTVPNSPTMMQAYPSMGMLPTDPPQAGGPPFGFMPAGPPVPYSNTKPAVLPPPVAQSSPRRTPHNIYGGYESPDSLEYGSQPRSKHTRARSTSQLSAMSSDSCQTKNVGNDLSVRPSSGMSMSGGPQRSTTPSRTYYTAAPTPPGVQYPLPPVRPDPALMNSPQSVTSRLSGGGHHRSLSLNAGSTPAMIPRPLSGAHRPKLQRVPSSDSIGSATSRNSYSHYEPKDYVDPAFLASSDDLANMQSPTTAANTRANASFATVGAGLARPSSRASPAVSYASLPRSRKTSGRLG